MNRKGTTGFFKAYFSGFLRAAVVAVLLLAQFALIFGLAIGLSTGGVYVYFVIQFLSLLLIVGLLNRHTNYLFKLSWLTIIAVVPFAGVIMYYLWGHERNLHKVKKHGLELLSYGKRFEVRVEKAEGDFARTFPDGVKQMKYLTGQGFPLYENNTYRYYSTGEEAFEAVIEDFEKAERFIFISFFIVAEGVLWERVKPILLQKAASGVEIRFIYDDFGSMFRTDKAFWQELEAAGVKVGRFNPIHRYLDKLYLNYRNHQKIIVIDGNVCYTGGFNLADEYINAIERFGYWKDGGVRIEGDGVYGMTCIFLDMWGVVVLGNNDDYNVYRPDVRVNNSAGFCQTISDGPLDSDKNPIEASITQLIYSATDFLYIMSPYLILEDAVSDALCNAADSGIDVRLVIPGIPDKKAVYLITKYNCGKLLEHGVRVYVYTPGFVHNKNIITENVALVGSINLDFRSFYLHFECGAYMWDPVLVQEIKKDYENTFGECHEMSYEEWLARPRTEKLKQWFLNIFAALM
ncbi:MAG: cardiolipin synthase [Lachnospiraceae bacterium]|nr:cardiolipin synthase [Lachnospiraceae bacterium]